MPVIEFDPAASNADWHLIGHVSIPSGNLLIADPVYLRDELADFAHAATAALNKTDGPPLGNGFRIAPGTSQGVVVRMPIPRTPLPVHAMLAGADPSGLPIGGLWIPFDPDHGRIAIDLKDDHWRNLGSFSVDGGRVALFDSGLVRADWESVNERIDEVIGQFLDWVVRLKEAQAKTPTSDEWPIDEAERAAIGQGILGTHGFELVVADKTIIVSSTGLGDGLYHVHTCLSHSDRHSHQPCGLWIDFGLTDT